MRTVEKVMALLEKLGEGDNAGVTELAKQIGADKSVVHRILRTLREGDWVEQDPKTRTYSIGPSLSDLLARLPSRAGLIAAAAPVLDDLVAKVDETSYFSARQGAFNVVELIRESKKEMRVVSEIGRRIPLHQGSAGHVLLAFERPSTRERLLKQDLPLLPDEALFDVGRLEEELATIRERGWSYDRGEFFPGVCGLAAPVMTRHGLLLGCICVRAPAPRLTFDMAQAHASLVVAAAQDVARAAQGFGAEDSRDVMQAKR